MNEPTERSSVLSWDRVLDDVTGALEALATVLDTDADDQVLLQNVCEQVVHAVPDVEAASITLLVEGQASTAATTDAEIADLDLKQYNADEGPCLEAARTGKLVKVAIDNGATTLWPAFAAAATEAGMGSFLSAPLVLDHAFSGAINCYGTRRDGFADLNARLLELYSTAAEAALRSARRYHQAHALADQLHEALISRAVIDQAKGILMAVHRVTADEAFQLLVEQSQRDNVKIRALAQRFVTGIVKG